MKTFFFQLTILTLCIPLCVCSQNKLSSAEKFLDFLNNYQVDSLANLLTDDFELIRTYSDFRNNKTTFLQDYIPNSKAYNGKYKILNTVSSVDPLQLLVEDQSDYFKYLKIESPKWVMTFSSINNRIAQLKIDSTKTYTMYLMEMKKKTAGFDSWISEKHTEIKMDDVMKTEGLLIKLLKEYAEINK